MISEKDRGQLLRMAGNIACGLITTIPNAKDIAKTSAKLALETLREVDKLIAEESNQ